MVEWLYDGVRSAPRLLIYAKTIFQLSNQTLSIKRDFQSLVDVLQNIGGVG